MQRYIAQRLLLYIPALLGASIFVFGIMHILPGDVAMAILGGEDVAFSQEHYDQLREALGLDDPVPVRYGKWLGSMVTGGFGGESLTERVPIGEIIARRLPPTLQLTVLTMIITIVTALPLGIIAALKQDKWPDYLIRITSIVGLAMPGFWVALLLLLGMVWFFKWSPPLGFSNIWDSPTAHLQQTIWPALVLSWGFSSYLIRVTRAQMLEVLRRDYIRTAHSKGLPESTIVIRHATRNALLPVLTLLGGHLDAQLSGTVILETIFGIPGLGQGIVTAAFGRDYPLMVSLAILLVLFTLTINLIVDLVYVFVDPRISYN